MTLPELPADRHRQVAGLFTERVRGTRSWDAPSPVAGWTVIPEQFRNPVAQVRAGPPAGGKDRTSALPASAPQAEPSGWAAAWRWRASSGVDPRSQSCCKPPEIV